MEILDALRKRKATFLADPEWRDVCSKTGPQDAYWGIHDIIVDLPSIFEETDVLTANTPPSEMLALGQSTFKRCSIIVKKLHTWYEELRSCSPGPLYWAVASSVSNPVDKGGLGKIFPFALEFSSLHVAKLHMFYWSIHILIFKNMLGLYRLMKSAWTALSHLERSQEIESDLSSHTLDFDEGSQTAAADKLARYICQSMEYCHRMEMGTLGPQICTFPKWAARQHFLDTPGHERELAWCSHLNDMKAPGFRFGMQMMSFSDTVASQ